MSIDVTKRQEVSAAEAFLKQVGHPPYLVSETWCVGVCNTLQCCSIQLKNAVVILFGWSIGSDGVHTKCAGKWACLHWL